MSSSTLTGGWYTDSTATTDYNITSAATTGTNAYITVTFDSGTCAASATTYISAEYVAPPPPPPVPFMHQLWNKVPGFARGALRALDDKAVSKENSFRYRTQSRKSVKSSPKIRNLKKEEVLFGIPRRIL